VFDAFESKLQIGFQIKSIVSISSNNAGTGNNKAFGIYNGQNIAGLGTLRMLIDDTFATLFGNGMRAIQVQMLTIKFILDQMDTLLPDLFKTSRSIPFLPMIVDNLSRDFFFSGWAGSGAIGNSFHWQPI
jgi:hypothetical protein